MTREMQMKTTISDMGYWQMHKDTTISVSEVLLVKVKNESEATMEHFLGKSDQITGVLTLWCCNPTSGNLSIRHAWPIMK